MMIMQVMIAVGCRKMIRRLVLSATARRVLIGVACL
jgi:hypothetical protein